ncbi:hypothetical protein L596_018089 [Steinernema carpocapsae]|uniref:Telomere length regulation protein conserved domain-containing protein n=1 Tax=Steinernema carpocapsae TaxID=34508 RepID=A0A4U5N405_STECR|nr:hypothetical protein L596_018089 [Steinernema carpocapsae]
MEFPARILAASERGNIVVILADIEKELQLPGNHDKLVDSLCSTALIPSFVGLLTANEFRERFSKLFTADSLSASRTLTRLISRFSEPTLTPFAFGRLLLVLEEAEKTLLERFIAQNGDLEEARHLTSMICSLPERIGNFVGVEKLKPSDAAKAISNHWDAVFAVLIEALQKERISKIHKLLFVKAVLQNENIFKRIVSWIYDSPNSQQFAKIVLDENLFDRREIEQLLIKLATLGFASSDLFDKLLGDAIKTNEIVKHLYMEKLLVQRLTMGRISDKLAAYTGKHGVAMNGLVKLMKIWADQAKMMCLVDVAYQVQLSKAVLDFGKVVQKSCTEEEKADLSIKVGDTLVRAMNDFLEVAERHRRQMGMFVAETLCVWFSTTPLKFDYEEDDLLVELRQIVADEGEQKPEEMSKEAPEEVVPVGTSSAKPQLDSDDEEEFEVYNTQETPREARNDLSTQTSPSLSMFYIRDCMDGLHDEKDPTRFTIALKSLEALILRRSIGFDDLVVNVAQMMVHLKNIFNLDDFEVNSIFCP